MLRPLMTIWGEFGRSPSGVMVVAVTVDPTQDRGNVHVWLTIPEGAGTGTGAFTPAH